MQKLFGFQDIEVKEKIMQLEFRSDNDNIKSGTLVKFVDLPTCFGIYLTDLDGKNPIIYDLDDDMYYTDIDRYEIEPVNKNVRMVIE